MRNSNKGMGKTAKIGLVLGAIIVTFFVATNYSSLQSNDIVNQASDVIQGDNSPSFTTQLYDDDLTMQVLLSNSLNGTSGTDDTTVDTNYYAKTGGGTGTAGEYSFLAKSTSGTIDVPTRLFTDGKIYAETVIPSGQAFLIDIAGTTDANVNMVKDVFYGDLDNVGPKHYTFGLDISPKLQDADPSTQPQETFLIRVLGEGSLRMTAGDTASLLSQSTGDQDATFEFDPVFMINSEAEVIGKAKVRVNSTSTSLWSDNDSSLTLTNGKAGTSKTWNLGSDFVESTDYSNSLKIYEKTFSSTIDGGNLVYVGSSGGKKIEATLNIGTTFTSATDSLCFELELTTVNAQGSETTISDDVEVTGASSNSDECSIS
jgi:hypothetical protein